MLEFLLAYVGTKGLDNYIKFFEKIFEEDLVFGEKKAILEKAANYLEEIYDQETIGFSIEQFITSDDFIENLSNFYKPFEKFEIDSITTEIDYSTLPKDFKDVLAQCILKALSETEKYSDKLSLKYLAEGNELVLEKLDLIISQLPTKKRSKFENLSKKKYKFNKIYIKRFIIDRIYNDSWGISYIDSILSPENVVNHTTIDESENFENTLIDQVLKGEKKRIVLLSVAGHGKSTELEFIAHYFSQTESIYYPLKISLNNILNESIEEFISIENNSWFEIPEEKLLIILDGLDEINANHIYEVFSKIEKFGIKYPKIQMIVSCRNNFYTAGTNEEDGSIKGFKSYYLQDISPYYIIKYVKEQLPNNYIAFFEEITTKKKGDLLKNPFYLIYLVDYFKSKNTLPNTSSDIINLILELKIQNDKEHFERKLNSFEFKQSAIFELAEKIAMLNQSLGKNYIDEYELVKLEKDTNLLDVLKYSFIIKKDAEYPNRRQFEHNNFQEYLAAKFLSKLELSRIKEYISFRPNFDKIKPYWLNTFTHLFNILENDNLKFEPLLNWIILIEPKALIQLEVENIKLEVREKIFLNIIDNSFKSCVSIYSEDFTYKELYKFSGGSGKIINYLLVSLKTVTFRDNIIDIVELISNIENVPDYEEELVQAFKAILEKQEHYNLVYHTLNAIARLKITDDKFINYLVEKYKNSPSIHKKNGLLSIFLNSDNTEELTLQFIKKTNISNEDGSKSGSLEIINDNEPHFLDDNELLHKCFRKIISKEGLIKLIEYFINDRIKFHFEKDDKTPDVIIENLIAIGQVDDIFKIVLDLFKLIASSFEKRYTSLLVRYFEETNTIFKAFKILFDESTENKNSLWTACHLVDMECVNFIIDQFKSQLIFEDTVYIIRNGLGWDNKKLHDYFYKEINQLSNNKFTYPPLRDYEAERVVRMKEDINLLFDKSLFEQKADEIFEKYGNQLTRDQLNEIRKEKQINDEFEENIVNNTLREIADKHFVTKELVKSFVLNDNRWIWFKLSKLDGYTNDKKYLLPEQINFIEDWCHKNIYSADFVNSVKTNEDGTKTYQLKEYFLFKFFNNLKLDFPKDKMLDMLEYEFNIDFVNGNIESYLVEKLSENDIKNRVLSYLRKEDKNLYLLTGHIKLIEKYNIKDALPFLITLLKNNMVNEWVKQNALSVYLKIGGHKNKLIELLNYINYKENWNWQVFEVLAEIKSKKGLTKLVKHESLTEENWKFITKALLQFKEVEGLKIIYDRLISKQTFDFDYSLPTEELKKIPFDLTHHYLILILSFVYGKEYKFTRLRRLDEDVFRCLEHYISINEELYLEIIEQVKTEILNKITDNEKKAHLNTWLQRVEKSFYTNKFDSCNIDDIILKINKDYKF